MLYSLYMGGDVGETVIETGRPDLPSILIYGDSFTNPVECLAYYSFDEMRSIDLRHYKDMTLADYIQASGTMRPCCPPTSTAVPSRFSPDRRRAP